MKTIRDEVLVCLSLPLFLAAGCGPSQAVLEQQQEQIRQEYERQSVNPPGLSAAEKRRRAERLEMDFGDVAPQKNPTP